MYQLKNNIIFILISFLTLDSNPMESSFLLEIVQKLEHGQNVIFTKYGDGEYLCMAGAHGANCDGDSYHSWLSNALKKSLVSLSKKPNTYLGKWWTSDAYEFCNQIAVKNGVAIPWTWYHLVMNDDEFLNHDYMYRFVKYIVNTKRKKIFIGNSNNRRLTSLFKVDAYVEIPPKNWSYDYKKWRNILEKLIEQNCIILISAGLCSKVLIDDITNQYQVTCIDLGSSFDLLATGKKSRPWKHSYEDELNYYHEFIPINWN